MKSTPHLRLVRRKLHTQKTLFLSILFASCAFFLSGPLVHANQRPEPWKAVVYRELPDSGDYVAEGREMTVTKNARYGIDINSNVVISVNGKTLERELSKAMQGGLSPKVPTPRVANKRI